MAAAKYYPNLFSMLYPERKGVDWIRRIDHDDLQVFVGIGNEHNDHGRMGGRARASQARRDARGRFVKGGRNGNK